MEGLEAGPREGEEESVQGFGIIDEHVHGHNLMARPSAEI